ncbi:MAG: sigma-70 family RNA polymerase sigma factor [Planctomycetota bacterium]
MTSQAALTAYAHRGDAEAFSVLVRTYQSLVYGTAMRRLRHDDDAREATQQTFIKLAKQAETIRARSAGELAAWLHRTTINTCKDLMRSASRRRGHEAAYARSKPTELSPDGVSWEQVSVALDEAVAELDDERRALVVEHFLAGRPQRELAQETGISQATVSRRLESAVSALRETLTRRGVTVPAAGALATTLSGASAGAVPATVTAELVKVGVSGVGVAAGTTGAAATASAGGAGLGWGAKLAAWLVLAGGVIGGGVWIAQSNPGAAPPTAPPSPPPAAAPPVNPVAPGGARVRVGHPFEMVAAVMDNKTLAVAELDLTATGPGAAMSWAFEQAWPEGAPDGVVAELSKVMVARGQAWRDELRGLGVDRVGWVVREPSGATPRAIDRTTVLVITPWPGSEEASQRLAATLSPGQPLPRHGRFGGDHWLGILDGPPALALQDLRDLQTSIDADWLEAAEAVRGAAAWAVCSPTAGVRDYQLTQFEQQEKDVRESLAQFPEGEETMQRVQNSFTVFRHIWRARWMSAGLWLSAEGQPEEVRFTGRMADAASAAAWGPDLSVLTRQVFTSPAGQAGEAPSVSLGVTGLVFAALGEDWDAVEDRVGKTVALGDIDWRPIVALIEATEREAPQAARMNELRQAALAVQTFYASEPEGVWAPTLEEAYDWIWPDGPPPGTAAEEEVWYAPPTAKLGAHQEPGGVMLLLDGRAWEAGDEWIAVGFVDGHVEMVPRDDQRLQKFVREVRERRGR